MHKRLRWLRAATALLCFGPLLAGLMGQGCSGSLNCGSVWSLIAVNGAVSGRG